MSLVAGRLDGRPMVRHGLVAVIHVDVGEVGVDQLVLVERRLDSSPVSVGILIQAGDRVDADGLPCIGEALVFLGRPLDARLARLVLGARFFFLSFGPGSGSTCSSSSASSLASSSTSSMSMAVSIVSSCAWNPGHEAAGTEPLVMISSMLVSVLLNCGAEPCAKGRAARRRGGAGEPEYAGGE